MPDQQVFRLRWCGRVSGPHRVEQLKEMLARNDVSLMHEVEVKDHWLSLEDFLANTANEKSQKIIPFNTKRAPQTHSISDRVPPAREERFYVVQSGRQQGPYAPNVLRELVAAGFVSAEDLAWKEGLQDWVPLARLVPDLAAPSFAAISRGQSQFHHSPFKHDPAQKIKGPSRSSFRWQEFWDAVLKVLLAAGGISILVLFLWAASKGGVRVPSSDDANHPLIIMKRGRR